MLVEALQLVVALDVAHCQRRPRLPMLVVAVQVPTSLASTSSTLMRPSLRPSKLCHRAVPLQSPVAAPQSVAPVAVLVVARQLLL